jgi:16S rRNA (guanine966-N2)-methyltransferase
MRIIAGSARGVPLESPKGQDIRPTLDRVRETVFNIITPYIDENTVFMDLFTGTGANGLEALSRGAKKAILVDSSPKSTEIALNNAKKTRLDDCATIERGVLPDKLPSLLRRYGWIEIVYADPPFDFTGYQDLLEVLDASKSISGTSIVVIEHQTSTDLPESVGSLARKRCEDYGHTSVSFYERTSS